MTQDPELQHLLREWAPQVLGAVVRRVGHPDTAEDAVQEALLAAAQQWPVQGRPDDPRAWLITVAFRRATDALRRDTARRRREDVVAGRACVDAPATPGADEPDPDRDDTLLLLFLCCHPSLTPASRIALTLRAVGGLTTAEIARAFLVPESTMAQRISRAKQRLRHEPDPFDATEAGAARERLGEVLHVLYLIFTEGSTATSGSALLRRELSGEAIRLLRSLHRSLSDDGEVAGLLALMLLTDARSGARTGPGGELIPLAEQDRSRWDREAIEEGVALVSDAMARCPPGPYQLQAAIAALHDEAATAEQTDWPQILALYHLLERLTDNPMVTLNRAVARAMVHGPRSGLAVLDGLEDRRLEGHHRADAVRGHLFELAGERAAALAAYRRAIRRTPSLPERRYLEDRVTGLVGAHDGVPATTPASDTPVDRGGG